MSGDRHDKPSPRQRRAPAQPAATRADARAAPADHSGLGLDLGTPISSLPNLGPASEAQFAAAGIHSAEALRALGADAAYAALLASGTRPHFIGYYVLHMALQGRPWNDCKGAEKAALRASFDAIKAAHSGSGAKERQEWEAAMQFFGVIERRG